MEKKIDALDSLRDRMSTLAVLEERIKALQDIPDKLKDTTGTLQKLANDLATTRDKFAEFKTDLSDARKGFDESHKTFADLIKRIEGVEKRLAAQAEAPDIGATTIVVALKEPATSRPELDGVAFVFNLMDVAGMQDAKQAVRSADLIVDGAPRPQGFTLNATAGSKRTLRLTLWVSDGNAFAELLKRGIVAVRIELIAAR
jgi:hypothetical protein